MKIAFMPSFDEESIHQLCAELGIDTEYWDIWGHHHITPLATRLSILESFGLDVSSAETLEESARRFHERHTRRPLDPVCVVPTTTEKPAIGIRIPGHELDGATISVAIYWEDSEAQRFDAVARDLDRNPDSARNHGNLLVLLPLPAPLPLGYHEVEAVVRFASGEERRGTQRLIVTPPRAWQPEAFRTGGRLAGLSVSLYGLRSERNWGAGDFTDLRHLVRWVSRDLGAACVALNPLHALHNRQPYNTSPYLPLSAFYRNYLYLDVEAVEDFAAARSAHRLLGHPAFQQELDALRDSDLVEYERVARLKLLGLRLAFRRFRHTELAHDTARAKAFRKWRAAEGALLERFAIYCALDAWLHRRNPDLWIWPDWPECYRDPESPAVRSFAEQHRDLVLFHEYVQWQIDQQLASVQSEAIQLGMPIGLYHDLALATDRCGADLWSYRDFFVSGCRVGSPPDDFAPEGQDWAFPPPNAESHREDGYRLFVETIRKNSKHGGALRIDHVMRFFRLFWIPDGMTAREGTYVNERWQDLLGILALESVRGRFLIIGEDLGTVPPALREGMERYGMLSYRLFWFERGHDGLPKRIDDYPRHALVSSTTHDLPTLAGFWAMADIDARRDAGMIGDLETYEQRRRERTDEKRRMIEALVRDGLLPRDFPRDAATWTELTGELHHAIIGYLVSTPSALMLLNQEDLTKELVQQNLPGTTWQFPNWRRKMRTAIENLDKPPASEFARMFRDWLARTGRLSSSSRK